MVSFVSLYVRKKLMIKGTSEGPAVGEDENLISSTFVNFQLQWELRDDKIRWWNQGQYEGKDEDQDEDKPVVDERV